MRWKCRTSGTIVASLLLFAGAWITASAWAQDAPEGGEPDAPEAITCDNTAAYPSCDTGTTATSWKCWQKTLTSSQIYTNGYREVVVQATLTWDADPAYIYRTYAYWDGKSNGFDKFTFRMGFGPFPGSWTWSTACISGCAQGESGLVQSGTVTVSNYAGGDHPLYSHGFLTQRSYTTGNPPVVTKEPISHYDRSWFFWQGDTAWAAPLQACRNQWREYIDHRKAKHFTLVQLGLSPIWAGEPSTGSNRGPKNKLGVAPFEKLSPCTESGVVPNNCSRWIPAYWEEIDGMIRYANQQGIAVLLAGLISPYDRYPQEPDVAIFARNLAARVRGNFVILSPPFDDKPTDTAYPGKTIQDLMNTAAAAARGSNLIYPLLVNHYGTISSEDMSDAHAQSWLNANGFQSGHNDNVLSLVTGRARTLAQEMRGSPTTDYRNPRKPALNLEAIYDYGYCSGNTSTPCSADVHFNEYRGRQAGWLSAFSGSTGYTMGSAGLWEWGICNGPYDSRPQWMKTYKSCGDEPHVPPHHIPSVVAGWRSYQSAMNRPFSEQARIMGDGLRLTWWWDFLTTQTEQDRIIGNPSPNDTRMVLARAGGILVAYLPHNSSVRIQLNGSNVHPTLNRALYNTRAGTWQSSFTAVANGDGSYTYTNPTPLILGRSDQVLLLRRSSSAQMAWSGSSSNTIEVYPSVGPEKEALPALNGQVYDLSGIPVGPEVEIYESPAGVYPRNPAVARDGRGNFVVAWEERTEPDTPARIYAKRLSSSGTSLGPAFEVSEAPGFDQLRPAVGADSTGRFLITWTERSLTTTRSYIRGQAFDANEFPVGNVVEIGSQGGYEVDASHAGCSMAGDCVVAWERVDETTHEPALRGQRVSVAGALDGVPYQINESPAGDLWLLYVGVAADGASEVRWEVIDTDGESAGSFNKLYNADGSVQQGEQAWTDPITG